MHSISPTDNASETEIVSRPLVRPLLGLALFVAIGTALWTISAWEPRLLPIRTITLNGELQPNLRESLKQTIAERLHGGILTSDLHALQQALEALPWVGRAGIRRIWPDTLQVSVAEHRPIARWNDDGLVTNAGVVFYPRDGALPAGLARLRGEDAQAPEVVARYRRWRDPLMEVGQLIQGLSVDRRGDWRIKLITGTTLRLGTTAIEQRLARFIACAARLEAAGVPRTVDLRYGNGFAVVWANTAGTHMQTKVDRAKRSAHQG